MWVRVRGPEIPKDKRWTPTYVLNLVCISAIVLILVGRGIHDNFRIGLTFHEVKCLEGTGYFLRMSAPDTVERGRIYAYRSKGLAPLLPDGHLVVKIAAAVPGDRVRVDETGIYINDVFWGPLNDVTMGKVGLTATGVAREYTVAAGQVLMLGNLPRSYDGRYIGPVPAFLLEGPAWMLW
jgi:conjugal transfer pilin signal peptidase TrbI